MTRRAKWVVGITLVALAAIAAVVALGFLLPHALEKTLVKAHTQEVRQWGEEYSSPIFTDLRAFRVIEMMGYMAHYYKAARISPGHGGTRADLGEGARALAEKGRRRP